MLGTIVGDIIGSTREMKGFKPDSLDFELFPTGSQFTDDTVLTAATADACYTKEDYGKVYAEYAYAYPHAGYGGKFVDWVRTASTSRRPYGSYGNGSAMRVGPVAYFSQSLVEAAKRGEDSASCTHDHIEGLRGARTVAVCVFMGLHGRPKKSLKTFAESHGYKMDKSLDEIRKTYSFDPSCQGTVPQAIQCVLESNDFEHAVRLAVSLGGDADTLGAIAGSIAEAYYGGVPVPLANEVYDRLDKHLRTVFTTTLFRTKPKFLVGKWADNIDANMLRD